MQLQGDGSHGYKTAFIIGASKSVQRIRPSPIIRPNIMQLCKCKFMDKNSYNLKCKFQQILKLHIYKKKKKKKVFIKKVIRL